MIQEDEIRTRQAAWCAAAKRDDVAAEASARSALVGLSLAVDTLSQNLRQIGYPPVQGRSSSGDNLAARLQTLESTIGGTVPPIVKLFWQHVGGISLVDLDSYAHVEFWKSKGVKGIAPYCDGVHVDAGTPDWSEWMMQEFADWRDGPGVGTSLPFMLSLAPDGYHKDNISGGPPYGVCLGAAWLARWENFTWPCTCRAAAVPQGSPIDFLGYLRIAILECAGFPGLYGDPAFEPFRAALLAGVSPF